MQCYESIIILKPSLSDSEVTTIRDKVTGIIENEKSEILVIENWGKKKLAYEVKKEKKGYYIFFNFNSPSAVVAKLDHFYKVTDSIIKYFTLNTGNPKPMPVPEETPEEADKTPDESISEKTESKASGKAADQTAEDTPSTGEAKKDAPAEEAKQDA